MTRLLTDWSILVVPQVLWLWMQPGASSWRWALGVPVVLGISILLGNLVSLFLDTPEDVE